MKKSFLILSLVLALASGLGATAGEGAAAHHIDWFSVLGKVVNSAILFGGLFLAMRKPLIRMLSQKGADIRNDFDERAKNLVATESRLREVGQRLDKVAAEVEKIKGEAESAGKAGLSQLEKAGRLEAERIVALGEEEIRQRVEAAVREVKGRIADLAIARFKDEFTRSLDDVGQQKIIERNIDACEDLHEGK